MIGLGTILNVAGILCGGLLGLLGGRFIASSAKDMLIKACGLCTVFLGISGAMKIMLGIGGSATGGTLMIVASMALGTLVGEALRLETQLEQFGQWLKLHSGSGSDSRFVEGFVTATMTVCSGAMSVVGSIQDGISGDYSMLMLKAILDFIIIMVMTSSLGRGCLFAAVPVAVVEGGITLLASFIGPMVTQAALDNLSVIGSMLIFSIGVNLVWGKKFSVVNMLPSILVAVLWAYIGG